ncbi:MAG: cytochrome P450 [Halioglobus sp.]
MNKIFPMLSAEYAADPFPFWANLRKQHPVYFSEEFGFWVVTRYADILEMSKRPLEFSSSIGSAGGMVGQDADEGAAENVGFLPMIQHDPPEHTRLRALLKRSFTSSRMAALEPAIRNTAQQLQQEIHRLASAGDAVDLYEHFASPLPVTVIAELLGIPADRRDKLRFWNQATGVGSGDGFSDQQKLGANKDMSRLLAELISERREAPGDDLISALVQIADEDGDRLRPSELLGFCKLLWIAGNETTTNLITNGALVLQAEPQLLSTLQTNSALIPAFVEELLRYEGPANGLFREAAADIEFRGQHIRKGDAIWLLWAAGNRDPNQFSQPDNFDISRNATNHLAFGHGIHFCLGAHLAKLEAQIAFEGVVQLLQDFRCVPQKGRRLPTPILRGWLHLPMEPLPGPTSQ